MRVGMHVQLRLGIGYYCTYRRNILFTVSSERKGDRGNDAKPALQDRKDTGIGFLFANIDFKEV
jgi:hypothetical protein